MDANEQQRLIEEAKRGTRVGELLESYRNYLRLLVTSRKPAHSEKFDRSDVVQETLIKAHSKFSQFQGQTEAELAGWLRTILARQLVDMERKYRGRTRARNRETSIDQQLEQSSLALGQFLRSPDRSPSDSVQRRELAVLLANALERLRPEQRDVIMMRNIEELTWTEIGEKLDRAPNAARMLWTRALRDLRPLIQPRL